MTERESIRRALEHLHPSENTLEEVMDRIDRESSAGRVKRIGKGTLRTVLIAALMAALSVITALAVSDGGFLRIIRNEFNIRDRDPQVEVIPMQDVETGETRYFAESDTWNIIVDDKDGNATSYTIAFMAGENTPEALGDWTLGELPEGFEQTAFSRDDRRGQIRYTAHPAGRAVVESIDFSYELPGMKMTFYQPFTLENVTVNGADGVLIRSSLISVDGYQQMHLFWFSAEAGVGFTLQYYGDPDIDLIGLAGSVEPLPVQ